MYARFARQPAGLDLAGAPVVRRGGREIELVANGNIGDVLDRLKARSPEALTAEALTFEEVKGHRAFLVATGSSSSAPAPPGPSSSSPPRGRGLRG